MTTEKHMGEKSLKLPYSYHNAGMCLDTTALVDGCTESTSALIAAQK
jgi:hypothetical protein